MAAKKTQAVALYWAHLETSYFSFDAFGVTKKEALANMKRAWKVHSERTGAESWDEYHGDDETNVMRVAASECWLDGSYNYLGE